MPLMPIFDMRKLGRFFSREVRQDQISNANGQIQYAKEHRIIDEDEEPTLARELAPRKVRKALRKVEKARDLPEQSGAVRPQSQLTRTSDAAVPLEARREPLLLPRLTDAKTTDD
jgi:hypothetical protein